MKNRTFIPKTAKRKESAVMKRIIPFLCLALAAVACDKDAPTMPTDGPEFAKGGIPGPPEKPGDGDEGTVVESASGDYLIVLDGRDRQFRFYADRYDDGSVVGEWWSDNKYEKGGRNRSHGLITCFTIGADGEAWCGGTHDEYDPPHEEATFRVVDGALVPGGDDESSMLCPGLGPEPYPDWGVGPECEGLNGVTAAAY
jgi:hypothetical protein